MTQLTLPFESERQDKLHKLQQSFIDLRFGMFIHFNMATFQNLEWGDPRGPTSLFNPTNLDTDQWIVSGKAAGMTYACLTTKHHDGFAIWPTKTGGASVKDIDVVRAYVNSCRKFGMQVGLYYSILDLRANIRNFDITPEKVTFIKAQLTELFTEYGTIDLLIFDGWNAPWSRIIYEELSFQELYTHVKTLQPNCLVMDLNAEAFPDSGLYYNDIKSFESNAGQLLPLGNILPAISCFTLTDGWFFKDGDEDRPLKSVDQVVNQWLIPLNQSFCNVILNAPPTKEGILAPNIVQRLQEIGTQWHPGSLQQVMPALNIITHNLALRQPIYASASLDTYGPDLANDGQPLVHSWTLPQDEPNGWLEVDLRRPGGVPVAFNTLILFEPVGRFDDYQDTRIASYRFLASNDDLASDVEVVPWTTIAAAEARRVHIHRVDFMVASRVRLEIQGVTNGPPPPHVAEIGVYNEPL